LPAADRGDRGDQDGGEPEDRGPCRDELGGDAQAHDRDRQPLSAAGRAFLAELRAAAQADG